jgi:hypothetical protein
LWRPIPAHPAPWRSYGQETARVRVPLVTGQRRVFARPAGRARRSRWRCRQARSDRRRCRSADLYTPSCGCRHRSRCRTAGSMGRPVSTDGKPGAQMATAGARSAATCAGPGRRRSTVPSRRHQGRPARRHATLEVLLRPWRRHPRRVHRRPPRPRDRRRRNPRLVGTRHTATTPITTTVRCAPARRAASMRVMTRAVGRQSLRPSARRSPPSLPRPPRDF